MHITYLKLIQTCWGKLRDLNPSNIVNIFHQMLDPGQRAFSAIIFLLGFYPVWYIKLRAVCWEAFFKVEATDILVLQKLSVYGGYTLSLRGIEIILIQQSIFVGEIIKHVTNIKSLSLPLCMEKCAQLAHV